VPVTIASKRSLDRYPRRVPRLACRLGNALADRITVNAEAVASFVATEEGCRRDKMVLIPNGVNEAALTVPGDGLAKRSELGISDRTPVVGAVSRLAWKKGMRHLLAAVPRLLEVLADLRVIIVGDGPLRSELAAQASALGVEKHIAFLGSRSDALELLSTFDVFVLPSEIEGMSNALLEAMAVGRPVVATDVGGNPEVVVDGETGFVVPPADPDRLAAAILKLLQAPDMAREMGAAGRQRVCEEYRVDVMVRRIENLYDSLLKRRAA
jgi:glycosyltransferase involved in cell wall biosynthesis